MGLRKIFIVGLALAAVGALPFPVPVQADDHYYEKAGIEVRVRDGKLLYIKDKQERVIEAKWSADNFVIPLKDGQKVIYTVKPAGGLNRMVKIYMGDGGSLKAIDGNDTQYPNDISAITLSPDNQWVAVTKTPLTTAIANVMIYQMEDLESRPLNLQALITAAMADGLLRNPEEAPPDFVSILNGQWDEKNRFRFQMPPNETWIFNPTDLTFSPAEEAVSNSFFKDVDAHDPDYDSVREAWGQGWFEGHPDGTAQLDKPINRAEFVKIAIAAFKREAQNDGLETHAAVQEIKMPVDLTHVCPDAPVKEWYAPFLYTAKTLGLVEGYPNANPDQSKWPCAPTKTINRAEALKIILKLAEVNAEKIDFLYYNQYADTDYQAWYAPYTAYARIHSLFKANTQGRIYPGVPITRRELVTLVVQMKHLFEEGEANTRNQEKLEPTKFYYRNPTKVIISKKSKTVPATPSASSPGEQPMGAGLPAETHLPTTNDPFGSTGNRTAVTINNSMACSDYRTAYGCKFLLKGASLMTVGELQYGYKLPGKFTSLWQGVIHEGQLLYVPYEDLNL